MNTTEFESVRWGEHWADRHIRKVQEDNWEAYDESGLLEGIGKSLAEARAICQSRADVLSRTAKEIEKGITT